MTSQIENKNKAPVRHELIDEALTFGKHGDDEKLQQLAESLTRDEFEALINEIIAADTYTPKEKLHVLFDVLEYGFLIVSCRQERTGLPYNIMIDSAGLFKNDELNIKVIIHDENFPETIPEIIPVICRKTEIVPAKPLANKDILEKWVFENYETLLKHRNDEIDDGELVMTLTPVK